MAHPDLQVAVDLSTVCDSDDRDRDDAIVNDIHHSVIADPNPGGACRVPSAVRTRFEAELRYHGQDSAATGLSSFLSSRSAGAVQSM